MDGNAWCATRHDFVNLQESPAGFGDTPMIALGELLLEETKAAVWKGKYEHYDNT
jgi:hypothetical protein